jgi:hypothetical protein
MRTALRGWSLVGAILQPDSVRLIDKGYYEQVIRESCAARLQPMLTAFRERHPRLIAGEDLQAFSGCIYFGALTCTEAIAKRETNIASAIALAHPTSSADRLLLIA